MFNPLQGARNKGAHWNTQFHPFPQHLVTKANIGKGLKSSLRQGGGQARHFSDGRFTRFAEDVRRKSGTKLWFNYNHQQVGIAWEWCLPSGKSTVCYGNPSDSPIKHGDCPYMPICSNRCYKDLKRQWLMIHELELVHLPCIIDHPEWIPVDSPYQRWFLPGYTRWTINVTWT